MKVLLLIVLCFGAAFGYPTGPPLDACQSMTPAHGGNTPQTTASPYLMRMNTTTYSPGDVVEVTLRWATDPTVQFLGMFVQARPALENCMVENADIGRGSFSVNQTGLQTLNCNNNAASGVAHSNRLNVNSATFLWTAPSAPQGHLYFRATVVQSFSTFWVGVQSPVLQDSTSNTTVPTNVCATTTPTPGSTTMNTNGNGGSDVKPSFCVFLLIALTCMMKMYM